MTREEIVNVLLNMRPQIISIDEMENLSTQELIQVYGSNKYLNYCDMIIKLQMISVIMYMGGPVYNKKTLLLMEPSQVYQIYLAIRGLTEAQFNTIVTNAIEDFRTQAKANEVDDYMSFSDAELVVATGIITPNPLLSYEEVQTQSTLKRIDEITKEIDELQEDSRATEEQLRECTNYVLRNDLQQDLICNGRKIAQLQDELKNLITKQRTTSDDLPRK